MKLVAPIFFVIGALAVTQASTEEVASQPLTRAGCDKAGLTWNENSLACGVTFNEEESEPQSQRTAASEGQPLTREDCELAGMHWNDSVLACEESAEKAGIQADAKPANAPAILINIDKATQEMTVSIDGEERYRWKVSTGLPGYSTPSGAFTARSMNKMWYSREWDDAPMPHSIFFTKRGHAIHGTEDVRNLGKPASHGCVRLSPENAAKLFTLVADNGLENTQVVLAGLTPGRAKYTSQNTRREAGSSARKRSRYSRVGPRDEPSARPKQQDRKKRGGLFRRLFGRQ